MISTTNKWKKEIDSMSSNRGYGFRGEVLDSLPIETKVAFTIRYLPNVYEKIGDNCESLEDWQKFFDEECSDYFCSDSNGFGNIFAEVLRRVEDWNVDYATGENNYSFLMLNECLPWQMSEKMKSLTMEKFEETVNKYLDELKEIGKQGFQINFEHDTVEYD